MNVVRQDVVVVSERLGALGPHERRIEESGATVRSAPLWTAGEIRANGREADVIILGAVEPFDGNALNSLPNLKAVVRRGVGYDNVAIEAATRLGIVVAYVPDATVEEVSDHALALLLAIERRILPLDRAVHAGIWQREPAGIAAVREGARRIAELTLGIVGFGRIGRATARKAQHIYGRILVADPHAAEEAVFAQGVTLVSIEDLLTASDHISLHAALLGSSRHLINEQSLRLVRPGAVLVNTSRGGLVDESAVLRAIEGGTLGGAGLDVTEHEPLPLSDPLMRAEGMVLTGHSAAASATATLELARRSVDSVIDILEGRRPAAVVNEEVYNSPALRATALGLA